MFCACHHTAMWASGTYRVFDIVQGGREGVDELVGQLGQEADGVHVQNRHAAGKLAGMDGDIQGGEELVSGLEGAVPSQSFDQSGFPWADNRREISTATGTLLSLTWCVCVYVCECVCECVWVCVCFQSHHSLCIPAQRRWGTRYVCAGNAAGVSSCAVFPAPSESLSLAPSAAAAGPQTASHLWGAHTELSVVLPGSSATAQAAQLLLRQPDTQVRRGHSTWTADVSGSSTLLIHVSHFILQTRSASDMKSVRTVKTTAEDTTHTLYPCCYNHTPPPTHRYTVTYKGPQLVFLLTFIHLLNIHPHLFPSICWGWIVLNVPNFCILICILICTHVHNNERIKVMIVL